MNAPYSYAVAKAEAVQQTRGPLFRRLMAIACTAVFVGLWTQAARGIDLEFTLDRGSEMPRFDPNAAGLVSLFDYAESFYEDVFEDKDFSVTLDVGYAAFSDDRLLGQYNPATIGIRLDSDRNWFIDPTPADNSEFTMSQTFWRDISDTQKADWYSNYGAPGNIPDTFEVGFRGRSDSDGPTGFDMLSVVLHEVGHALGMNALTLAETLDGDFDFDPAWVFGNDLAVETSSLMGFDNLDVGHVQNPSALMSPIIGPGIRGLPSHTDLFAMASALEFVNLDVPRREFYGNSNWQNHANWSGNARPGSGDEVFVRAAQGSSTALTARLNANAFAGAVHVAEGANVDTNDFKLEVAGDVDVSDPDSDIFIEAGGELEARDVSILNEAEIEMSGGTLDVRRLTIGEGTQLESTSGTSTVDVLQFLVNNGQIDANDNSSLNFVSAAASAWDLDGDDMEAGMVDATDGNISFASGGLRDVFNGTVTIGGNHTFSFAEPWSVGSADSSTGLMEFTGNGVLDGGRLDLWGTLSVTDGTARIEPSMTVKSGGNVSVAGGSTLILQEEANFESGASITVDGTLRPQAFTRYRGGTFTGAGTIDQNGTARFIEDTVIDLDPLTGVYNMDGIGVPDPEDIHITINPGRAVTITANRINTANNEFGGRLVLDSGELTINTENPWTMAGSLEMRRQPFADPPLLDGSPVIISGELNANGEENQIGTAVTFEPSAQVSVPIGVLRISDATVDFLGGSFTGGGEFSPLRTQANVHAPTTITLGTYHLSHGGTTTILPDGHLILDVGKIDDNNLMHTSIALMGGDLTVQQSEHDHWVATFLSDLLFRGLQNTPDLNGQPVTIYGKLTAEDGLSRINVPVTFGADPDFLEGGGVETATVHIDAGAELEFNEPVTIEGGDFDGDGTMTFNKAATIGGIVNASVGRIQLGEESSLTMTGGSVRTDNFEKHADAELDLQGGFLGVIRGTGTLNSDFAFGGGTDEFSQPVFAVHQGADVAITRGWTIGENEGEFGRTEVATVSNDGTRRSVLRSTQAPALGANLIVGKDGTGELFVQGGGLVQLPGSMIVGLNETGSGEVLIAGVLQGHRAEIDVRHDGLSDILVGGTPNLIPFAGTVSTGELTVLNGGFVQGSGDLIIAARPGSEGTVTVGGHEAGFDAEIILDGNVFVGGNATQNGGDGTLTVNEGGSLTAKSMFIRGPGGLVEMTGGELHLETLNTTFGTGGEFSLGGGVVAVDEIVGDVDNEGGTISPGDSPGITTVSGNYSQGPDARLFIELGGTTPGDQYDQLQVGGTATLDGTLEVELFDSGDGPFVPGDGDMFEILTAGSGIEGTFADVLLPELTGNVQWDLSYRDESISLAVLAALLEGDYNNNGRVEQGDLNLVLLHWGENATLPPGDWIDQLPTGTIDQDELNGVLLNWGNTAAAVQEMAAVPEPSSLALLALAATGLAWRRVRRTTSPRTTF